jgi:hypothetical protein
MGALRLAGAGFTSMPRTVAIGALFGGGCVAAFGAALPFIDAFEEPEAPAPRIALEPEATGASSPVRNEVHGLVRLADGEPAAAVRITLTPLFSDEGAEAKVGRTDDSGRFAFSDLDVTPGTPYVAEARFDGSTFPSEVLRFGRSEDDPLRIVVAPTTRSAEDLVLALESIALVGDEKGLQAVHAVTVHNRGDHAYIGGLRLPLLPGANAIDPRAGLDRRSLELHDGALISSVPVVPGRHDITYTYIAAVPRSGLRMAHRPTYETARFEVLVGGELEATNVEGLSAAGHVRVGPRDEERSYRRFEVRDVGPEEPIGLVLSAGRSNPALRVGGIAAAAVAALALFAFPLIRRRRRVETPPVVHEPVAAE